MGRAGLEPAIKPNVYAVEKTALSQILSHDKRLSIILLAWPTLPAPLKDAILAIIRSVAGGGR